MRRIASIAAALAVLGGGWWAIDRAEPDWYVRLGNPLRYESTIRREAARQGLDPALVAAVIKRESDWVPDARSERGAVGLMQLLPSTAEFIATHDDRPSAPPSGIDRPEVSIAYGTWYLAYLMRRFGSTEAALAAYNAGEGNLSRWIAEAERGGRRLRIPEDVPLGETRAFVAGVRRSRSLYARAYREDLGLS